MFTNKKLQEELTAALEKLESFEGFDFEGMSAEIEGLNETITQLEGAAEEATMAHADAIKAKDEEIAELKAAQADFEEKLDNATAANLAQIGHAEPVKAEGADTTLSREEHLKAYRAMTPGAERLAYFKKHLS